MTIADAQGHKQQHTIQSAYNDYRDAKPPLVAHLGAYCSYCEEALNERNLDVEHIEPKTLGRQYETSWDNLLLSCKTCNGRDNKGTHHVLPANMHLPHKDNTFMSFEYLPGGFVIVNRQLKGVERQRAETLYKLIGLDKHPQMGKDIAPCDKRWQAREEAWHDIELTLAEYQNGEISDNALIRYAKRLGHWSMWFTQFAAYPTIRARLIKEFSGTCAACFDANNGYSPICRQP